MLQIAVLGEKKRKIYGCNPLLRSCNRILVVRYPEKSYSGSERRSLI